MRWALSNEMKYWRQLGGECGLHPLIHTFPTRNFAQDVEKKKAEPVTPHFLGLNQDMVAWFQEVKCGLKYVIQTSIMIEVPLRISSPQVVLSELLECLSRL